MKEILFKRSSNRMIILLLLGTLFFFTPALVHAQRVPCAGSRLPQFELQAPKSEEDRQYLGITSIQTFSINQIDGQLVLVEIMGVYCPRCHLQAPLFNQLFEKIRNNPRMDGKIKLIAIAAGATPQEVEFMRRQHGVPFPLLEDPNFNVHQLLGEPRTPFTMLISKHEIVLASHPGVIDDIDSFLQEIEKFIQ